MNPTHAIGAILAAVLIAVLLAVDFLSRPLVILWMARHVSNPVAVFFWRRGWERTGDAVKDTFNWAALCLMWARADLLNFAVPGVAGVMVPSHIGGHCVTVVGNPPVANSAGTRSGTGFDRSQPTAFEGVTLVGPTLFLSAILQIYAGATTGTPTSFTVDAKIQHSNDNGVADAFADYTDPKLNVVSGTATMSRYVNVESTAASTLIAANSVQELDVNLQGAKRYIRVVEVVAFVAGSSPTVLSGELVTLGGSSLEPI